MSRNLYGYFSVASADNWHATIQTFFGAQPENVTFSNLPAGYQIESVSLVGSTVTVTIKSTSSLSVSTNLEHDELIINDFSNVKSGITYGSHNLSIAAQNLQGYNATLAIAPDHGPNLTLDGTGKGSDTTKLFSPVGSNKLLANKQWGYTLTKVDDTNKATAIWNNIKDQSSNPTSDIIIPEAESNGDGIVTKTIYYGARLDNTSDLTKGSYSTQVQYTVTGIPEPEEAPADLGGEVCRSGDVYNSCKIDIDANMIPVKYTGDATNPKWTAIANPEGTNNKGEWYDYSQKQWANAVTVSAAKNYNVTKQTVCVIPDLDNRCAESQDLYYIKRDTSNGTLSALEAYREIINNIDLYYSSYDSDTNQCSSDDVQCILDGKMPDFTADILGYWVYIPRYDYQVMRKDATDPVVQAKNFTIRFRKTGDSDTKWQRLVPTESVGSSDTINNKAWATHPAFSWCTNPDYTDASKTTGCTELNGIWVGKFETTGTADNPTVLPGVSSLRNMTVGAQFDAAKKIGVEDVNAVGGIDSGAVQNSHNLAKAKSHMLKNSEWGAVVYLITSKFGAGGNAVNWNDSSDFYTGGGSGNAYADNFNQSSTANVTGIYDMSGGAFEYVAGAISTSAAQVTNNYSYYYGTAMRPPYVDLYLTSIFTNNDINHTAINNNQCTWATCGGHALHETKMTQPVSSSSQSWWYNGSNFVDNSLAQWFLRGEEYNYIYTTNVGVFASDGYNGSARETYGFRVALLSNQ